MVNFPKESRMNIVNFLKDVLYLFFFSYAFAKEGSMY